MNTKSKIAQELIAATELSTVRGETQQAFILRVMKGVTELSDDEWEKLSQAAKDWFNSAADAKNGNAEAMPDFPDIEQPAAAGTRRRGAAAEPESERITKVGDDVVVKTKRGKEIAGTVVEVDDKVIVVKTASGDEEEFSMDRVAEVIHHHGTSGQAEEPADPLAKGAAVTIKTKRGKEVTGDIVEIDDEVIVLLVDGKEEEFSRDRVETITPKSGPAPAPAPASSRRGAAASPPAQAAAEPEKPKRASNPSGISVGQRIREIMAANASISQEDVGKMLTKEGLDFAETSLRMNYGDCVKFLAELTKAKRLK